MSGLVCRNSDIRNVFLVFIVLALINLCPTDAVERLSVSLWYFDRVLFLLCYDGVNNLSAACIPPRSDPTLLVRAPSLGPGI